MTSPRSRQGFTLLEVAMAVVLSAVVMIPLMYAFNRVGDTMRMGSKEILLPAVGSDTMDEITRSIRYADQILFAPDPYGPATWPDVDDSEADWPRFACHLPDHPLQPIKDKWVMYRYNPKDGNIETKLKDDTAPAAPHHTPADPLPAGALADLNDPDGWTPLSVINLKGVLFNHAATVSAPTDYPLPFRFTDVTGQVLAANPPLARTTRRVEITLLLKSGGAPPLLMRTSVAPRNIPHF